MPASESKVLQLNMDYLDPHALWKPTDGKVGLVFDKWAAILHVFRPYFLVATTVFLCVVLPIVHWLRQWQGGSAQDRGLLLIIEVVFLVLPAVGIFLPAYIVWSWQAIHEIRVGPWLRLDQHTGELILTRKNLRLKPSSVRWSLDYVEDRDKNGLHRRAQLLLLINSQTAHPQTLYVTASYGKKSLATIRALSEQYARLTGTRCELPAFCDGHDK
jgi:hypothetical protein